MTNKPDIPDPQPRPDDSVREIERLVRDFEHYTEELNLERLHFSQGTVILEEGQRNDFLFIIVQGEVEMSRHREDGRQMVVDTLRPGSFLGLLSFWSEAPTFSRALARTEVVCLSLNRERFEGLVLSHPNASIALQTLLANSLANRYRHMVKLNIAVQHLSEQLESERNQLRHTVEDLERTRRQLVVKERLALLGQLLAGIAHEINNPSAALQQSLDDLLELLPGLFETGKPFGDFQPQRKLLQAGLKSRFHSASQNRIRLRRMEERFPGLDRTVLRRLAALDDNTLNELAGDFGHGYFRRNQDRLDENLEFFDIGANLKRIQLAIERITQLVHGLKAYNRPLGSEGEPRPARELMLDSLTVLNHRLKHFEVDLSVDGIPDDVVIPAEFNQVFSNVLLNSCEATPEGGKIQVHGGYDLEKQQVEVIIRDTGPGIDPAVIDRMFEANFTTKSAGGQFGLGLGLAISRDIMERHHGTITPANHPEGGASFALTIPAGRPGGP